MSDIEKQLNKRAIGFDNNDNDILKGMRKNGGEFLRNLPSALRNPASRRNLI